MRLQESLQSQQLGGLRLADQHRTAGAGFDQPDPTQDQRAHDALAKVRLGDDQRAQLRRRHQERLDILLGVTVDQRVTTGELRDFAGKLPPLETRMGTT